jgi:hypothetical protein
MGRTATSPAIYPTMSQTFALPPPPEETFETRSELISYLKAWGAAHGYAPVIKSSNYAERRAYVGCNRGGTYRNTWRLDDNSRKQSRGRIADGCRFQKRAKCRNGI